MADNTGDTTVNTPAERDTPRARRRSGAASQSMNFDQMGFLQQLIMLLFMPLVQKADITNKSQNELFSGILGFKDTKSYTDWHRNMDASGWNWKDKTDFSRADFKRGGRYVADHANIPPSGKPNFDEAIKVVLRNEGGFNAHEPDGSIANFGINSKANPDIDVRNLTAEKAIGIYKQRYWDSVPEIEKLDRASAIVAMDASVNHGPAFARRMIAACGANPEKMIEYRREAYHDLAQKNPAKYGHWEEPWNNRLAGLEKDIAHARADEKRLASTSAAKTIDPIPGDVPTSKSAFNSNAAGKSTELQGPPAPILTATAPKQQTSSANPA
jgi:lysozyme family protein